MLSRHLQLEEANTLLRAEAEAATRLRKTQTESSKQLQQLEANVRELQDKCCLLERSKLSLEKECISLQAALETERREHSQGSETISDLMGSWHSSKLFITGAERASLLMGSLLNPFKVFFSFFFILLNAALCGGKSPLNVVSQPTFVSLLKRLIYEDTLVGTNTAGTEQAEELLDLFMCVCVCV